MIDLPPFEQQVIEAVTDCGIQASDFVLKYEDYLQSHELTIDSPGTLPPEEAFACVHEVEMKHHVIVTYTDQTAMIAYHDYTSGIFKKQFKIEATKRLLRKGLLPKVPEYDPENGSLSELLVHIEKLCSVTPGTMLELFEGSFITLQREFIVGLLDKERSDAFACAQDVIAASNLDSHGISFVILGNEAHADGQGPK